MSKTMYYYEQIHFAYILHYTVKYYLIYFYVQNILNLGGEEKKTS